MRNELARVSKVDSIKAKSFVDEPESIEKDKEDMMPFQRWKKKMTILDIDHSEYHKKKCFRMKRFITTKNEVLEKIKL